MRDPRADKLKRSSVCYEGRHDACRHLHGFGTGFNPRRLHLESGAGLCACECHASCPGTITSQRETVPLRAWGQLCTCPGAEGYRLPLDRDGVVWPDVEEHVAQQQRDWRARKQARDAVRARAAGLSRDQVKDLYQAELRARDLDIPPEALLDADVSLITADYLGAARAFGRAARGFAGILGGILPPR